MHRFIMIDYTKKIYITRITDPQKYSTRALISIIYFDIYIYTYIWGSIQNSVIAYTNVVFGTRSRYLKQE